jgi:acyl-CoA synthetase (AMP-forming)/AMP-acid ligase II
MTRLEAIEAELLADGGPFALAEEEVLGERLKVFRERPRSLRELVERSRGFGEAEYLVYRDRRISFAEHDRLVASVAAALRERFGVAKGDRVAIFAANHPAWIVTWWAATCLGAVPVGLNGWWTRGEAAYGIADCDPKVLVGDAKRLARLERDDVPVPVVEIESGFAELERHAPDAELPDAPIAEDDPATILYTSGTTGRPKGAVVSHRNIACFVQTAAFHGVRLMLWNARNPQAGAPPPLPPAMLCSAPLFHLSGLFSCAVSALAAGLKTVWTAGRFDPEQVLALIEREHITSWSAIGTMAPRVLDHPSFGRYDVSSLRNVGFGGSATSAALQARVREAFPTARAAMGLGYGLTESVSSLTIIGGRELEEHPESVGRPLPGVEIEIRDEEGKPLPEGVDGEILARAPGVFLGYWRNPEATAAAFAPGRWLRTGDFGRLVDGRLYINSRMRDLILRAGENVYPAEVEHCLEAHAGVTEAAVIGVDHPELGQEVMAIVVPAAGARVEAAALEAWCRERLAYYKVPVRFELRAEPLPRNATGKLLKNLLAQPADNPFLEE